MNRSSGQDAYTQPSFTLANRLHRMIWNVCCALLFRMSPRPLYGWRAMLLRLFGARVGRNCHVYPGARIWAPWNLELGDCVGIGDGAILYCMDRLTIGDYAVVSQGAHLCAGTHDHNSAGFVLQTKPISVGAFGWICAEAFVHPGVDIAEGVVLGARAVAIKDLAEPWTVYAGNPCVKVGSRSDIAKSSRSAHSPT